MAQKQVDMKYGLGSARMTNKLIQYDVYEDVGQYLDEIQSSLKRTVVEEYKKFLHLKSLMNDTEVPAILSPSQLVDQVWHVHMMRPIMYREFCQEVFGKTIDHDIAGSKDSEAERNKRRERTRTLLKIVFNEEPDGRIWEDKKQVRLLNSQVESPDKQGQSASNVGVDYFVIISQQSGKVLDASLCQEDEVILFERHDYDNQLWFWDGQTIRNKQYPSKVLDFGSRAQDWKKCGWGRVRLNGNYFGGPNQKWSFSEENGGVVSHYQNMRLDVYRGGTKNGTTVGVFKEHGRMNQLWSMEKVPKER